MFTTQRLRLRAFQQSDLDHILVLYNEPRCVRFMSPEVYHVPRHLDNFEWIVKAIKDALMYCTIEELETGYFVGFALFMPMSPKNRNAVFGVSINPTFWSRGYGSEVTRFMVNYAFVGLGVHRVSLNVYQENTRAIELYKRLGFVEEGRIRKSKWIDGGWQDDICMGILEDEWAEFTKQETASKG